MSLADTQSNIKKYIFIAVVITGLYYIGKFTFVQGAGLYGKLFPKAEVAPESKFGVLPKLKMTSLPIEGTPTYVIETTDAKLPTFPDRIKVYPLIEPQPSLLKKDKITKLAKDLGFVENFAQLSSSDYKWIDGANRRTMLANIVTENFELATTFDKLSSAISSVATIKQEDATEMVSQFIKAQVLVDPADTDNLTYETIPTLISFGKLRETSLDPRNAKLIKVNVYRNIPRMVVNKNQLVQDGTYKIVGPNPKDSNINFYATNEGKTFKFPIINFNYWSADLENGSEYYLSPIEQVWGAVQQNKGVIAYAKLYNDDYYELPKAHEMENIQILNISLGYFESKELEPYLQPIYIFEGKFQTKAKPGELAKEGDIIIYYPAVRGDFVEQ